MTDEMAHICMKESRVNRLNHDSTRTVYLFGQENINFFQSNIKKSSSKFNPDLICFVGYCPNIHKEKLNLKDEEILANIEAVWSGTHSFCCHRLRNFKEWPGLGRRCNLAGGTEENS